MCVLHAVSLCWAGLQLGTETDEEKEQPHGLIGGPIVGIDRASVHVHDPLQVYASASCLPIQYHLILIRSPRAKPDCAATTLCEGWDDRRRCRSGTHNLEWNATLPSSLSHPFGVVRFRTTPQICSGCLPCSAAAEQSSGCIAVCICAQSATILLSLHAAFRPSVYS